MTCSEWTGCYGRGWQGVLTSESFAHPAKFSRGLIERIVSHMLAKGWLSKGDTVGDPFGGIGTGGIVCADCGIRWVGVELEPKFVELAEANFAQHRALWDRFGDPQPRIVQGDSREFARIVGECSAVVTSPPYAESLSNPRNEEPGSGGRLNNAGNGPAGPIPARFYGTTPGQIGRMKAGELDAVISSPPYANANTNDANSDRQKRSGYWAKSTNGTLTGSYSEGDGYGHTPGNIGNLPAGKLDACVTSPPYGKDALGHGGGEGPRTTNAAHTKPGTLNTQIYGQSDGQIGNTTGTTYWEAMRAVYEQVRLALKPGGVAGIVLKDYVSKGKRVPLCDDTLRLLEHVGFVPLERVRAMLVRETVEAGLFGEHRRRKERKSFFRRLAESKGSPRIDWEEVLFVHA